MEVGIIVYFVLIHIAGLGLGMYLQEKITKYSMLKKEREEKNLERMEVLLKELKEEFEKREPIRDYDIFSLNK